jgi:threonine dehydrogenase-like Zn-dependent dehydrogenase
LRAITFEAPIPRYLVTLAAGKLASALYVGPHACTRCREVATPELPGPDWVRIRTRMGGICGSDTNIVTLGASPSASPFSSFPFVLGHENVGEIAELGRGVRGFAVGERVVVNPLLCCEPRGIAPPCAACAAGHHSRCAHFTDGALAPGMFIGTTRGLGGSWGEWFVAHASQLVPVGEGVPDDEAVLTEPFACCVQAVHRARPAAGQRALVIGAGTMGLLQVAALRALAPGTAVTVLARHAFQAAHATRLGAARVVLARGDYLAELADAGQTRLLQPILGAPIGVGGFDVTFVCIGSARSVEDALRFTTQGGTIVLLGNASALRSVDWTPLWLKELTIAGTLAYGATGGVGHGGASTHAFHEAAGLIGARRVELSGLVTHQFGLGEYRRALATARERGGSGSVKVAFRF